VTLERELYAPLVRGARAEGHLLYRIPDARNTGLKPGDIIGVSAAGAGWLVEAKRVPPSRATYSPRDLLEAHQLAWAAAFAARPPARALEPVLFLRTGVMHLWEVMADETIRSLPDLRRGMVGGAEAWLGWPPG